MQLYDYQLKSVEKLFQGKHFIIAPTGSGKTAIGLSYARATRKPRVLVVTTASVRDSHSYETEALIWGGGQWFESLRSFDVVSWAGLVKFVQNNWEILEEFVVIFDEVRCAAAGISSNRGRAFLQLTNRTDTWAGFTATPGDKWIQFYPYFTACKLVRNKTEFMKLFCLVQNFRGFREIVAYRNEDILKKWWGSVSYVPDTSKILAELPEETGQVITLSRPQNYKQVVKTRTTLEGEFLDSSSAMCHYLRELCNSQKKQTYVTEFLSNLETSCVIFYNYKSEASSLGKCVKKASSSLGKCVKIWKIDGDTHEIPTAETIGQHDVVLVQYQAGSMGLNLQFINHCLFYSPNYSYSISKQAKGRIRRIGQTKPCHYYFLKCQNTIEEDIYKILHDKKDFSEDTWLAGKE